MDENHIEIHLLLIYLNSNCMLLQLIYFLIKYKVDTRQMAVILSCKWDSVKSGDSTARD